MQMKANSIILKIKHSRKCWKIVAVVSTGFLVWYILCLPKDLFRGTEYSTVVVDRDGELLGARIAKDGQWRFSEKDKLSMQDWMSEGREKYFTALVEFEDRWFRWHLGINPVAIGKAIYTNIRSGHVVSGGSTITMQVIRMSRRRERTIRQKIIEAIMATRLELRCSKDEILQLYAEHAPFGGNVVGLEAASWRYFGRPASELSWGEAATLAVLPNAPSSIHLEKSRDRLKDKRDRLLYKLSKRGKITSDEYRLACSEPLPDKPAPLPSLAARLVDDLASGQYSDGQGYTIFPLSDSQNGNVPENTAGKYIRTSIDIDLQRRVEEIAGRRSRELALEGVNDLAAIVLDAESGEVLAYCGNADPARRRPGVNVNAARAPRSSGSILKPFLYYDALAEGVILPYSLIADTPVNINGFTPQNYDLTYEGAVPAAEALSRSLNVPSVHLLKKYGVQKFLESLRCRGLTTLTRTASDYGLSLILGGGECRLDEVTAAYAGMARQYMNHDIAKADPMALYYTFDALKEVNRPDEIDWHIIRSVKKTAWKTGTSYGYRDAWAIGVNPSYAVGVWAGNASGAGAPGLLGARTAGPVMFEVFNILPPASPSWFPEPMPDDGIRMETCSKSGYLAGPYCEEKDTLMLPKATIRSKTCPYHLIEHGREVFRLTPAMEWFYRQRHPEYDDRVSVSASDGNAMEFIYPESGSRITLPRQMDGTPGEIVLNLAHHDKNATVYWHMDEQYLGETRFLHQMRVRPEPGRHSITAVDDAGRQLSISIEIKLSEAVLK